MAEQKATNVTFHAHTITRDDRWKLIRYPQVNRTQLFDLRNDPHEIHDLSGKIEFATMVADLTSRLEASLKAYGDECPLTVDNPNPAEWSPPAKGNEAQSSTK